MIYPVYICIHYVTVTADRTVGVADPIAALRQVDEYCWHDFSQMTPLVMNGCFI